jgi:hypothetical protein
MLKSYRDHPPSGYDEHHKIAGYSTGCLTQGCGPPASEAGLPPCEQLLWRQPMAALCKFRPVRPQLLDLYYWRVMLRQVITAQPSHDDILLPSRKFSECSAGNFTQMNDPAVPVWLLYLSEEQQRSD